MSAQLQEQSGIPLIKYSVTDAKLAELREKYKHVPNAETEVGYSLIKAALSELVPLRTGVDKKRKELKADSLEWGRKVDAEAKRITEALEAIERPLREAKDWVDAEAERRKQEQIQAAAKALAAVEARISRILGFAEYLIGATAANLRESLLKLDAIPIDDSFEPLKSKATAVHAEVRKKIESALAERVLFEEQQAIQAKQAAELKAQQDALAAEQAALTAAQEAHNAAMRAEQDKAAAEQQRIEREAAAKRDAELAAERAEAARIKAENDRLQREASTAKAEKERAEAAERKRLKDEARRPDTEKLIAFADELLALKGPSVKDQSCKELLYIALHQIHEAANKLKEAA